MTTPDENRISRGWGHIPTWLLVTVLIAFAFGLTAGLMLQTILLKDQVTLSPVSVISFVFTVALGGASIILAIITMALSRQAEEALTRRSDEGIRLQNDVFVRTNEVLSRIQTSTGVTEKRIEDIISGRTAVIAQEVLDKSLHGKSRLSSDVVERIKGELAESLRSELVPLVAAGPAATIQRLHEMEEAQKKRLEASQRWSQYRKAVVEAVGKLRGAKLVCEAEGNVAADTQEDFWDAVFLADGKRIALDIHTGEQVEAPYGTYRAWAENPKEAEVFANRIAWRAYQDNLDAVFLVWNEDVSQEKGARSVARALEVVKKDFRLHILVGSAGEVFSSVEAALLEKGPLAEPSA